MVQNQDRRAASTPKHLARWIDYLIESQDHARFWGKVEISSKVEPALVHAYAINQVRKTMNPARKLTLRQCSY